MYHIVSELLLSIQTDRHSQQ